MTQRFFETLRRMHFHARCHRDYQVYGRRRDYDAEEVKAMETVNVMHDALRRVRECPSREAHWLSSVTEALRRAGE